MKKEKSFIVSKKQMQNLLSTTTAIIDLLQNYANSDFVLERSTRIIQALHDIYFYMCCYDDDLIDISGDIKYALMHTRIWGEEDD